MGIFSEGFKIISIWRWRTFPCAAGCIEGLSLPSLLRGIRHFRGKSTDGGWWISVGVLATLATNLVHIIPQSVHKYFLMAKAGFYQLLRSGIT